MPWIAPWMCLGSTAVWCSLDVPWFRNYFMFLGCFPSLSLGCMFLQCALVVSWLLIGCVLAVHWMCLGCLLEVPWMLGCLKPKQWLQREWPWPEKIGSSMGRRILRDPFTSGLGPLQMDTFGLAGIWSILRDHDFHRYQMKSGIRIQLQQASVAQIGTPITNRKKTAADWVRSFIYFRRTFLVTCWHFLFAWKLAGKHEYVCNVHLSKMSSFWLKWVYVLIKPEKPTHRSL